MKNLFLLFTLFGVAACSNVPEPQRIKLRSDVLYFQNTDGGRKAAREISELYGAKQEVILVDQKLPEMGFAIPEFQASPAYPVAMKEKGVEGTVTLDFIVDELGGVFDAVVVESTNPGFNMAAIEAIRKWKFKPAQREGVDVRARLRVPLVFQFQGVKEPDQLPGPAH